MLYYTCSPTVIDSVWKNVCLCFFVYSHVFNWSVPIKFKIVEWFNIYLVKFHTIHIMRYHFLTFPFQWIGKLHSNEYIHLFSFYKYFLCMWNVSSWFYWNGIRVCVWKQNIMINCSSSKLTLFSHCHPRFTKCCSTYIKSDILWCAADRMLCVHIYTYWQTQSFGKCDLYPCS